MCVILGMQELKASYLRTSELRALNNVTWRSCNRSFKPVEIGWFQTTYVHATLHVTVNLMLTFVGVAVSLVCWSSWP